MTEGIRCTKISEDIKDDLGSLFIFGLFFTFLLAQHHLVGMYFDDFGNSSLSYAYDSSHIAGTNYSLTDLVKWAVFIYKNWGGRIIYALMLIPLQKNGPHLFMAIQAIVIILTYIVSEKLVRLYYNKSNGILAALIFIAGYGLIKGDSLSNGYYWASASVLYVWPLLPFVSAIYFYEKMILKRKNGNIIGVKDWWMLWLLIPLAVLSQEQLGGGFFVWVLFRVGADFFAGTKWKGDLFILVFSFVLLAMMILAPGNFARMKTNTEYSQMSIQEKIGQSFKLLLGLLNHWDMLWFNMIMVIFGILMLIIIYGKMNKIIWFMQLTLMLPCLFIKYTEIMQKSVFAWNIILASFFVFQVVFCVVIVECFIIYRIPEFIPVMMAAISSVYCLLIAPTFSLRQCIPYVFLTIIFVNLIFQMIINETKVLKCFVCGIMFVCLLVGMKNMIKTYYCYEKNFYADSLNRSIMRNYDGGSDTIYLLKYDNSVGRGMMSCDAGFEATDAWMKEYYNIPANVQIVWKDISDILPK